MKLWGGRFTKETDQLVQNFNESLSFDQKFYRQDIRGSIAHVKMLAKQGILSEKDRDDIIKGLEGIRQDLDEGTLIIPAGSGYEDIHSFVEGTLTERIGEAGKRLHTGRSRNDQVALDMKLYTRDEIDELDGLVKKLLEELLVIMEQIQKPLCRALPICRRHSPLRWLTIWELILRCFQETAPVWPISADG